MLTVSVKPARDSDGHKACSTRGQLFDGYVEERLVVSRSSQPLVDACRILAGKGADPSTRVAMRHEGHDYDALQSTIGKAAKLTVTTIRGKTVFAKWQPWKAEQTHLEAPPMRQNEKAAV